MLTEHNHQINSVIVEYCLVPRCEFSSTFFLIHEFLIKSLKHKISLSTDENVT